MHLSPKEEDSSHRLLLYPDHARSQHPSNAHHRSLGRASRLAHTALHVRIRALVSLSSY